MGSIVEERVQLIAYEYLRHLKIIIIVATQTQLKTMPDIISVNIF